MQGRNTIKMTLYYNPISPNSRVSHWFAVASGMDEKLKVEFINFAQEKGVFSLALRNPRDIAIKETENIDPGRSGVSMNEFLDHQNVLGASGGGDLPVYVEGRKIESHHNKN